MVDELGIHDDLVDLALGAVAAHAGLLEYVVKVGILVHAVDDVVRTFFSRAEREGGLLAEHDSFQKGRCSGTLTTSFFCACGVSQSGSGRKS